MQVVGKKTFLGSLATRLATIIGAVALTLTFFLVLPLIQAITDTVRPDTILQNVDSGSPPPPPAAEEEPEPEPEEEEEEPPELAEESEPLSLSDMDIALEIGDGGGVGSMGVNVNLSKSTLGKGGVDELFSLADLDQKPRCIYQPAPQVSAAVRKKAPGQVYVLFIVNEKGKVVSPRIQKSTDPSFNAPALQAVKKWKFEPGKKSGKPVRFRMRVPITFPRG